MYTASDCFETFPFVPRSADMCGLEEVGREYYEFRGRLMVLNSEGLTATYNRFHDPDQSHPDIVQLRTLHAKMDRAALEAYGWSDLQPNCEFLLEYEEEDSEDGIRRRRKPWRYRWPDELRDEVLARLLELNHLRAEEQAHSLPAAPGAKASGKSGRKSTKAAPVASPNLFEVQRSEERRVGKECRSR